MSPEPRHELSVPATESAIDALLMDLAERVNAGEQADLEECCARHPEHAAELRRVFPTLKALADLGQTEQHYPGILAAVVPHDRHTPGTLGDFRIVREIGRGGMGIVYEAEQISLKRRVALKVLPFAAVLDKRQLQRFRTEAMAAARLHHQHIVPVYQVGCDRAVHFYAMQFIDGRNVAELIRETRRTAGLIDHADIASSGPPAADAAMFPMAVQQPGDTAVLANISTDYSGDRLNYHRKIAELGVQAAQALDFAHQHGILHRDIKPSNLMLDTEGALWVTDFGLARIEGDEGLTMSGDLLGTLRYMSPEQALGKRIVIDQRTDIYSLGVSLYEMLALRPAYDGADRAELLRQISFESTTPLRKLDPSIPADLETIVQTAMAREPNRRYENAQELADDLQRFLDNKPILARRPSASIRLQKWMSRNKHLSASLTLVLAAAMLATYGAWLVNKGQSPQIANAPSIEPPVPPAGRQPATPSPFISGKSEPESNPAAVALTGSDPPERLPESTDSLTTAAAAAALLVDPALPAIAPGTHLPGLVPEPPPIPDAGRWQLITRQPLGVIHSAVWSPDEERIALGDGNLVRIYNAATDELLRVLLAHSGPVTSVAWHPDGVHLASCSEDGTVRLWTSDGVPTYLLTGHAGPVYQVSWRPGGQQLASCAADGTVRIWSANGELVHLLIETGRHVFGIDWSPDGKQLATVGGDIRPGVRGDNAVRIWNVDDEQIAREVDADVPYSGLCVDWRPDGAQFAVGFGHVYRSTNWLGHSLPDAGVHIWNSDGDPVSAVGWDKGSVRTLAWSPDGQGILFGGREGYVHHWDAGTRQTTTVLGRHSFDLNSISWNRWGTKALTTSRQFVREDDPFLGNARQVAAALKFKLATVKWSPDGQQIAVDGVFFLTAQGEPLSPDQRQVAPGKWWERASHLQRPDGSAAPEIDLNIPVPVDYNWKFAWSKDGWLAGGNWWDHNVRIWDDHGNLRSTLHGHLGGVESVAWSPDGTTLVSGGGDSVRLWRRDGTAMSPVMTGHADEVYPVEWSPDGRWIASGSTDATVRLWRPNGILGPALYGHQAGIFALAWSPDAQHIASASWLDNTVRVWDIATRKTEWQALQLGMDTLVTFDPNGKIRGTTGSFDETQLLYVVEQPDGTMQILTFSEFRERFAQQLNHIL